MANIKSQIKRDRTSKKANDSNSAFKAKERTAEKKVRELATAGKKEEALAALQVAFSLLDTGARENIISANSVSRRKSHLQKLVNSLK